MKITIAHSPDSDDAFMFYGLAKARCSSRARPSSRARSAT
jgi:predicted solute-binding protein